MENRIVARSYWEQLIEAWAVRTITGRSDRAMGIAPLWIGTREIRILWEEGITRETAELVGSAVEQTILELNLELDFSVELWGTGWQEGSRHISVSEHIRPALTGDGRVKFESLFELSYREPYRLERQHADLYITTRPFHDDHVSWGASMFEYGCIVLNLHSARQSNRRFLSGVVKHEMGHLLGMPIHCDDIGVEGIAYDPACNMHYGIPSERRCNKCHLFLRRWWETIIRSVEWQ